MTDGALPPPSPSAPRSPAPSSPQPSSPQPSSPQPTSSQPTSSPPPPPPPEPAAPAEYTAYDTGVAGERSTARIGPAARWTVRLVAAAGVASVVSTVVRIAVDVRAADLLAGRVEAAAFDDLFASAQLVSAAAGVIGLAAAVLTVVWMFRVATNLRSLGRRTTWHPSFSVFGWMLPPFGFLVPLLVVREMWKASDPAIGLGSQRWRAGRATPLAHAWFVLYGVVPAIITVATLSSVLEATLEPDRSSLERAEAVTSTSSLTVVDGAATALAALAWVLLVRRLTARHTELTGES
ncbi:DUF4328 domain-containing protein [Ilumatobacter sp.]|uniref:DUF4328 domain-containing protein n=1 Tax=Ilumatobacter sp. TaxID=1967498 RepID=UPI003B51ED1F